MIDYTYQLEAYDYHLPPERIAQFPAPERDQARLLMLNAGIAQATHHSFSDIADYLRDSDLLVINTTRVFPARLLGNKETGGKVELFLLHFPRRLGPAQSNPEWMEASATALIKSSKRPKVGSRLFLGDRLHARVDSLAGNGDAEVTLQYKPAEGQGLDELLQEYGQIPLPPYIQRAQGTTPEDGQRYQTRYARQTGSVAAPTAGLHFSDTLLGRIKSKGVQIASIVLHVGYGTFSPVRTDDIRDHRIHREWVEISAQTADLINRTKDSGGRIWAVGTTTVRALECAADNRHQVRPFTGDCDLFIYPGFSFRIVDNLITNFHLPKSSLLFLVSALAGRERILEAYQEAIVHEYRFFSYGDAMAIINRP
jgi:S-adenosylmethionine:tRNA ribosyltransferase-isomerase